MMKDKLSSLSKRKGLLIVIMAALLLELLSGAQYYYTHRLMERELEKHAEMELTTKAILIKSTLNSAESILGNYIWDIRENLSRPDSIYGTIERMVVLSRTLQGAAVGFVPDYYPEKGKLYEPYVLKKGNTIEKKQIGGTAHDYTQRPFYLQAMAQDKAVWTEPYTDHEGAQALITSYVMPLHDKTGTLAGLACIDVSLEWLSDTINGRHIYPSSFLLLLTESGKPIIRPSEKSVSKSVSDHIISLINDSTVLRQESHSTRSKIIHFDTDKRDGTVFYANMKGLPHWQIAVVCYDDEVYGPLSQLRLRLLLLSLLAVGILLYVISRFAKGERELKQKTLEQERTNGELRIASNIQQALLPAEESLLKSISDVQVEGRLIPAKAVGGDLYNAFVRDGKLFFCIGDVSGKGIPSALIMAITQAVFRNVASRENNPAHIMKQLNEMACRNNKANIFVTLFIGVLDLPTGHLRYCNAGHEKPILIDHSPLTIDHSPLTIDHSPLTIDHSPSQMPAGASDRGGQPRRSMLNAQWSMVNGQRSMVNGQWSMVNGQWSMVNGQWSMIEAKPNLPIGLFEDFDYEMQTMQMKPGAALFLYTDGLTEARNAKGNLFGRERVMQMIESCGSSDPKQIVEEAVTEWHKFIGTTEQSDDLTLLALSYTPSEKQSIMGEGITLENDVREVEALGNFVKQVAEHLSLGSSLTGKLRLAVEEAVVNVMEYAYPKGTTGTVNIRAASNGRKLSFIITDSGIAFNPTEVAAADTTLSAEERPIGGLGILLVRELMDSINYERIDGKNVLTLSKAIPPK